MFYTLPMIEYSSLHTELFAIKLLKTSNFEWMFDNIRIEKIISAPILATNFFLEVSALPDV